jgi:hypothetical protein
VVAQTAHAATFWGFLVLFLTIIEAYGDLFSRTFAIPGIGHWAAIGCVEDLFAVGVLAGIVTFRVIRLRNDPHSKGRAPPPAPTTRMQRADRVSRSTGPFEMIVLIL